MQPPAAWSRLDDVTGCTGRAASRSPFRRGYDVSNVYDAIVVGARCAGSPTAMLLARKGYRVLSVDKARFPSDMPMSTHLVHQPGIARLERWGLLERVKASGCPPITTYHWDFGPFTLHGSPVPYDGVAEAYAPRRTVLDAILAEAAVVAGAELREGVSVEELTGDDGRVTGIRGHTQGGLAITEQARIVVGADGMHSPIARWVQAPEYNAKPPFLGAFFTYWSGVPLNGYEFYPAAYRGTFGWMTNDGLAMVACYWAIKDVPRVRGDLEGNYFKLIEEVAPSLAERVHRGRREQRFTGGPIDNYFRRPYGPGWALVGDAGYKKDPCTAAGITDAFRDAELLSDAIDAGLSGQQPLEQALQEYERRRNEASMAFYEWTCQLATTEPPPPEMQELLAAVARNQQATNEFFGVYSQTVPVERFFAPENIARITGTPAPE
jgi:flavin-dependent dehydrogenase